MSASIPICFYPMRKIVLDDDHNFSQSILLKMHDNNFAAYHSPNKLLDYLLNEYQPSITKSDLIALNYSAENNKTNRAVDIHIDKLKHLLSTKYHHDINVILVDYHMPEMCGLDFLQKISHLPLKKALITGETDSAIAIKAFNHGLVDAYIQKDELDFPKQVRSMISELEWKYFNELSKVISDIPEYSYLKNQYLSDVFKNLIRQYNIKSFCLVDMQGDFLAQDHHGNHKLILVRNESQLQTLARIADDDSAPPYVVEKLETRKFIPFFGEKEYWEIPGSEWGQYLYPANVITADPNVSWACVN